MFSGTETPGLQTWALTGPQKGYPLSAAGNMNSFSVSSNSTDQCRNAATSMEKIISGRSDGLSLFIDTTQWSAAAKSQVWSANASKQFN